MYKEEEEEEEYTRLGLMCLALVVPVGARTYVCSSTDRGKVTSLNRSDHTLRSQHS